MFAQSTLDPEQLVCEARDLGAPLSLVRLIAETGALPVPNFAAGGIATPADAALCRALGAESVFVGSGIFLSEDPLRRARAIVAATTYYREPKKLAEISHGLGKPMAGIEVASLAPEERFALRGN